jgi:hypothetical protein
MNYKIGDKVVRLNEDLYSNFFHYESFIYISEVTDANEEYFTTGGKLSTFTSTNYRDCYQDTGKLIRTYSGDKTDRWYNLRTEIDEIKKRLKEIRLNFYHKVREENDKKMAELEKTIENCRFHIDNLRNLKETPFGFGYKNLVEFDDTIKNLIERTIGINIKEKIE